MSKVLSNAVFWIGLIMLLGACNAKLSDEQRKRLIDGMKRNQIKKITDAQFTDAAFAFNRAIARQIGTADLTHRQKIDSLEQHYKVKIGWMRLGDKSLGDIERQIVEAYAASTGSDFPADNIQKIRADSILFTNPFMTEIPDGSLQFNYALGIKTSRKQIILSIRD